MLRINSKIIYDDEARDMTLGRRLARYLSRYNWYNPASTMQPVERITATDGGTHVKLVSPPDLDVAWEFFEHQMLPRRLAKNDSTKEVEDVNYERVEPGEFESQSKLYPVWKTPLRDMGDFGLGVGTSFS